MNFLTVFSSSSLFPFVYCFIFREGRKETSTDVSSQWRQSWCGGEEVNVEVSRREECYSQRVFLRGDVGHTHTIGAGEEIKKPRRLLFVLKNPHHLCSIPKTAALILGARDRQMVFFKFSFFLQVLWPVFPCQNGSKNLLHVVKSWISKKSTSPPLLTNQTKKKSWRQYVSSSGPNRMEQKKSGQGGGGGRVADG